MAVEFSFLPSIESFDTSARSLADGRRNIHNPGLFQFVGAECLLLPAACW